MTTPAASPPRLHALDQFRGYTVLGMFLVNFVGGFAAMVALWPTLKHHHTYVSYADTIMPQFLFAVGMAYRLVFVRRKARDGALAAYSHAFWRCLGLILLGVIVHTLGRKLAGVSWNELTWEKARDALGSGLKRDVFQALTHIGVTSLWVLPVIGTWGSVRLLYAVLSGALFTWLSYGGVQNIVGVMLSSEAQEAVLAWMTHVGIQGLWEPYYVFVNTPPNGIDGGPLGFLTWTIPCITGTLACDAFLTKDGTGTITDRPAWLRLLLLSLLLMLVGYGVSCLNRVNPPNGTFDFWKARLAEPGGLKEYWWELLATPPFKAPPGPPEYQDSKNMWTMSQRSGAVTYPTFCAGFSLLVFLAFWVLSLSRLLTNLVLAGLLAALVFLLFWALHPYSGVEHQTYAAVFAVLFFLLLRAVYDRGGWIYLVSAVASSVILYCCFWTTVEFAGEWYLWAAAFVSAIVFLTCWGVCTVEQPQLGALDTFGQNALVGYVLHDLVMEMMKPWIPKDAPLCYDLVATGVFFYILWLCLRHLEKHRLFLRL